ncbi:MAG: ArnT family glycosyltransferase [Planctomycetota bacterium]|jgi:4-amino-4-deoxy-L-arabinose transferase-like glycosyltransferase
MKNENIAQNQAGTPQCPPTGANAESGRSAIVNGDGSLLLPRSSLRTGLAPLLIIAVVILGYGIAPTRLPLRGEETCRALHGIEMVQSGDWLIATNQGVPILDRPPLQYWALALVHRWIHPLDPLTIRLFMVVVTLAASLVIWWYSRRFLSEAGAFLAAVAYPTMGHVFDLGRRAETDGLFALLMAGALMVWHYGHAQRWRPIWTWTAGTAVAALATLSKGLQGPVAFFGTVYLFLLVRRDWRYLFHWSHVVGIVLFLLMIAVWQVPFYLETGWEGTQLTWLTPFTSRLDTDIVRLLLHLVEFPLTVFGATLPWSVLLVGLFNRQFWRLEEKPRSAVTFVLLGMGMIFLPVWLSEGGRHRYVMPMYPLMAVVCGAVSQQCLSADIKSSLRQFWRAFLRVMAVAIAAFAAVFLIATIAAEFSNVHWIRMLAQPWSLMAVLVICAAAGAALVFRQTAPSRTEHGLVVTFAISSLVAICFNGPVINTATNVAANIGPEITAMRDQLPAQARLVSFGPVNHKFVYWHAKTIPILPKPETLNDVPEDLQYFAINVRPGQTIDLPFKWERIAKFNTDRTRNKPNPEVTVVVGRRIHNTTN